MGVGSVRLCVNDALVAQADDVPTAPMGYSMVQEGLCVGRSWGPPVASSLYHGEAEFTGVIRVVEMRTDASRQFRTG